MFDTRNLAVFQRQFLQAVTAAKPPIDAGLRVHHDTWLLGLIACLEEVYPATQTLLGDESFKAFARDYVYSHPLTSGDRNTYGDDFAGFLARHPALGLAWLPAVARYEFALHVAAHACDATPCGFDELLDPASRIALHPSANRIRLDPDIRAIHAATLADETLPEVPVVPCDGLVGRDRDDGIVYLDLAPIEVECLSLIAQERSLMTVLDQMNPSPDDMALLQILLARLVQHGLLTLLPEDFS